MRFGRGCEDCATFEHLTVQLERRLTDATLRSKGAYHLIGMGFTVAARAVLSGECPGFPSVAVARLMQLQGEASVDA